MSVDGIDVYFMPCLHIISDEEESWHCIIWGDLGCGQTLKTEITQGLHGLHGEPFNIEGMVELIYSNIEIYSAQGDEIPVEYSGSLPESDEIALYKYSLGAVRDYKTDEYRETTVCAELIENLYEAVQAGTIVELLQRESVEAKELAIAEKMDYIKKEETGILIAYDSVFDHQREKSQMKYYLLKGADDSSYVRNEGTYGTREPWYLYLGDEIDSGKEYYAILGQWEITEYLGESDYCYVENIDSEAPFFCATIHPNVFKRDIDIIVDKNGKAAMCVEGRFFRLEKSNEEELRTWE